MRPFMYATPSTVAEAVGALNAAGPGARVLGGGTTLYDLMKLEIETPPVVLDVHRISELATISTTGSTELVFGAGARMSDVAEDHIVRSEYPALSESLWHAASQQIRNMATLGGNLLQRTRCAYFRGGPTFACNKRNPGSGCDARDGIDTAHAVLGTSQSCIATYPGDLAAALIAFDAVVDVASVRGERTVAVADLHREPGDTPQREHTLEADELVVRIRVPVTRVGRASTYLKIRPRESYAFALAAAAVALELRGDGAVADCRIALGGVATRPWRAWDAERSLIGERSRPMPAAVPASSLSRGRGPAGSTGSRSNLGCEPSSTLCGIAGERASR